MWRGPLLRRGAGHHLPEEAEDGGGQQIWPLPQATPGAHGAPGEGGGGQDYGVRGRAGKFVMIVRFSKTLHNEILHFQLFSFLFFCQNYMINMVIITIKYT